MNITQGKGPAGENAQAVQQVNYRYGRSASAAAPSTDLSGSANNQFDITLNGDGPHTVTLPNAQSLESGPHIAASIERHVRVIRSTNTALDRAFSQFVCQYDGEADKYVLVSGEHGVASAVAVTDAGVNNIADVLKIGLANGGTEDAFFPRQNRWISLVNIGDLPLDTLDVSQLVPFEFDDVEVTAVNNRNDPETIVYRQDLAIVATLTITYDSRGEFQRVQRS